MISVVSSFFGNYTNFGEKTDKSVFSISDSEAGPTPEINKDNILIRDEGIGTAKNDYGAKK